MIRKIFQAVDNWVWNEPSDLFGFTKMCIVVVFGMLLIAAPVAIIMYKSEQTEMSKCLNSGRGWAIVGSHVEHGFIWTGKIMVPETHTVTEYGCLEVKR